MTFLLVFVFNFDSGHNWDGCMRSYNEKLENEKHENEEN